VLEEVALAVGGGGEKVDLVAGHHQVGDAVHLVDLDADGDLAGGDALGKRHGGDPRVDEHALDDDLPGRKVAQGDLAPDDIDVGQRRGRPVLLRDVAGLDVALVQRLFA